MKMFVRFMLLILVLGLAGPFFMKKPDGSPWMTIDDVLPSKTAISHQWENVNRWFDSLFNGVGRQLGNEQMGKTQVYRWQAPDGSWRFSDKPPQQTEVQGGVETVYVDPNTNMIEGLPSKPVVEPSAEAGDDGAGFIPLPMTVAPGQVQKMMDDARNIQTLMDERSQALEQMTGDSH